MIKRIVVVASPSHIRQELGSLHIEPHEGDAGSVPIEDIGLLVLEAYSVTITTTALAACAAVGAAVVVCDSKHMPTGLMLPMEGHTLQAKTLRAQIDASVPNQKRIWQAIVKAKVRHQAALLEHLGKDHFAVAVLEDRVRSGDPDNVEARAARMYWPRLFGSTFRRDRARGRVNSLLNYGYALLRAATARAVVGAGLSPHLGVHHHNQYDAFCLADDLMEPIRPLVDVRVWEIQNAAIDAEVSPETKRQLLSTLTCAVRWDNEPLPLLVAMARYAAAVRTAMEEGSRSICIPVIDFALRPAD